MSENESNAPATIDSSAQLKSVIEACKQARELAERVLNQKLEQLMPAYNREIEAPKASLKQQELAVEAKYREQREQITTEIIRLQDSRHRLDTERLDKIKQLQKTLSTLKQVAKALKTLPAELSASGLAEHLQKMPEVDFRKQIAQLNKAIKKLEANSINNQVKAMRTKQDALRKKQEAELAESTRVFNELDRQATEKFHAASHQARHEHWQTLEAIKAKEAEALAIFTGVGS